MKTGSKPRFYKKEEKKNLATVSQHPFQFALTRSHYFSMIGPGAVCFVSPRLSYVFCKSAQELTNNAITSQCMFVKGTSYPLLLEYYVLPWTGFVFFFFCQWKGSYNHTESGAVIGFPWSFPFLMNTLLHCNGLTFEH